MLSALHPPLSIIQQTVSILKKEETCPLFMVNSEERSLSNSFSHQKCTVCGTIVFACWPTTYGNRDHKDRKLCTLLEAQVAGTDYPYQRKSANANQHVSNLDQPVHAANEQRRLPQAKDRKEESIHNCNCSQNPQPSCANRHDPEDQESEGNGEAKQHVNIDEVHVGDPEQQSKSQCTQSSNASYPLYSTYCDHQKHSFR